MDKLRKFCLFQPTPTINLSLADVDDDECETTISVPRRWKGDGLRTGRIKADRDGFVFLYEFPSMIQPTKELGSLIGGKISSGRIQSPLLDNRRN